mgnify:CR=1 FL=1
MRYSLYVLNEIYRLVKEVYNKLYGYSTEDEYISEFLMKPENVERFVKFAVKNRTKSTN